MKDDGCCHFEQKVVAADIKRKLLRIIPFHAEIYMDHIVAPIYFFLVWTLDKVPNSSLPPIQFQIWDNSTFWQQLGQRKIIIMTMTWVQKYEDFDSHLSGSQQINAREFEAN